VSHERAGGGIGAWMMGYPDLPLRRWLHKAPVTLWRLGLGPMLGRVFILLTTRGRRSGQPRRTAVARWMVDGKLYAWCPYGERAQWYRNVLVDPGVTVQTRSAPLGAVVVRVVDDDELTRIYRMLRTTDPEGLAWYMGMVGIADDVADLVAKKDRVHFLRFDPSPEVGLPGQRADLAWLWAVPILLGWWWRRQRR
jgi:deazaflavin-dependent oxidoreductase (nitroreductase family)